MNLIWLCIYVGGDQMYDRFLKKLENVTQKSDQLLPDKKESLLKLIDCLKNNKQVFRAMHRSLFYINGAYYYGSNTLTGIRYVSKIYCLIILHFFNVLHYRFYYDSGCKTQLTHRASNGLENFL